MNVPFLDLKAQYASLREEIAPALQGVLDNTAFAGGPYVAAFEKNFASYCQAEHAVGVGSGTEALWVALLGLGIGPGDEVITAVNTFIATAEAISFTGATPVFVDVDADSFNIDANLIEAAITDKTKAIIPVHLYGQMADMDPIMDIAKRHNLHVIEDAAQAHGAEYKGKRAGSMGTAGCFSFYPGKNLGAYGEAGAVVTQDAELATKMRNFRDHGQAKKYHHGMVGWNARMDGFQGAVLDVKLKHLPDWNQARHNHARLYNELFAGVDGVTTPKEMPFTDTHVYHIYPILVAQREALMAFLQEQGIASGIHYPIPLHLQDAYAAMGHKAGDFPVAERLCASQVSLPMFAELTENQIKQVVAAVQQFMD
ncbi:DegT/DnrJ/EryC1/StrS family aminotransferase [Candidatus Venteria ishoeyi]|uniref:DegT/DnrJ/EryC1/StrS family aminotransferase n=1 Tax=Candidatus Venteria ishoeyi TaxID=1899563 RepID=UPI0025A5E17C|nr:DegT/DnrJ/EryC1/StrS family aminotransferase [Candidatus Venteria ishoeyi]MDM8548139.1 DegT/DnrJ/EryC1/StrS family aminotransferase [Candidatus Venteria ishoeyi]